MRGETRGRRLRSGGKQEGGENVEFRSEQSATEEQQQSLMHQWVGEEEEDIIDDQELAELDEEFAESRIVDTVEGVLTSRRTKPSTKVRLLMKYFHYSFDDAKEAVKEAVKEVGFRRGTEQRSGGTYSRTAKGKPIFPKNNH